MERISKRRGQKEIRSSLGVGGGPRGTGGGGGGHGRLQRLKCFNLMTVLFLGVVFVLFSFVIIKVKQLGGGGGASTSQLHAFPILPIQHCEKYTTRPTDVLEFESQTIRHEKAADDHSSTSTSTSIISLDPVEFSFLKGSKEDLSPHNLYPFANYLSGFEGGVSYVWISILQSLSTIRKDDDEYMVLDGGMNTGFYTTLSAAMGFHVHAFELQRDCFDVVQAILESNPESIQERAHLYNIGISNQVSIMQASEGCDPSYSLKDPKGHKQNNDVDHKKRKHSVAVIPLDSFLDQARQRSDGKAALKKVAILKLDIEGAEIPALQGLVRHLDAVQNIVMEFAPWFAKKFGVLPDQARLEFRRLEAAGFVPYKLWSFFLADPLKQNNTAYLKQIGLETVPLHPILKTPMDDIHDFRKLWKIVDWDKFLAAEWKGCNIWFARL